MIDGRCPSSPRASPPAGPEVLPSEKEVAARESAPVTWATAVTELEGGDGGGGRGAAVAAVAAAAAAATSATVAAAATAVVNSRTRPESALTGGAGRPEQP